MALISDTSLDQNFSNPVYLSTESGIEEINHNGLSTSNPKDFHFKPTTISWSNINVFGKSASGFIESFLDRKKPSHIIKNISGHCEPGDMLAIIGASGAGKTTLLNVLTGRNLKNVNVDGKILLNHVPTTVDGLSKFSSYVQQDDLFFNVLTVREHLKFQLNLRSPVNLTNDQVNLKINQLLERLGLMKVADTRINCESTGQKISGGERKRLSIATEIITDPSLLFCDEPTSGIDSFMAQSVVSVLKSLASEKRTIILTIHQPSSQIFKIFDKIMLLAEGRVAFCGKSTDALNFFSRNSLNCPANYNPTDFFIQQLSVSPGNEDQCRSKINAICKTYEDSEYLQTLKSKIDHNESPLSTDYRDKFFDSGSIKRGVWTQFRLLVGRFVTMNLRDPLVTVARVVFTLFSIGLLGVFYWRQDYNQEGIQSINGAIFLLLTNSNFSSIFMVINTFCLEIPILLREQANGLYHISIYYIARIFCELPYFIILPFILWAGTYYTINLYNDFTVFLIGAGVLILVTNAASAFGYLISAISKSVTIGLELAPTFMAPLVLLGGTFLNSLSIPVWLAWIKYLSWMFYANEILTVNQWQNVDYIDCDYEVPSNNSLWALSNGTVPPAGQGCLVNGRQVIASVGFKKSNLSFDYQMLGAVILIFHSLSFLSLWIRIKIQS